MNYIRCSLLFIISSINIAAFAQQSARLPEGFRKYSLKFQNQKIDLLICTEPGEELVRKPLLLFIQGSLPIPLIKFDTHGEFPVFPFSKHLLAKNYHLIIISKPGIPLSAHTDSLESNMSFNFKGGNEQAANYFRYDNLDYYVKRNIFVLKHLLRQKWAESQSVSIIGHSEGAAIGIAMTAKSNLITHLAYLSGNPFGRGAAMLGQFRKRTNGDQNASAYIDETIKPQKSRSKKQSFYGSFLSEFKAVRIPVHVIYGTKDPSASALDLLRITIGTKKNNIQFSEYPGLEHNFFPEDNSHRVDYEHGQWDEIICRIHSWIHSAIR